MDNTFIHEKLLPRLTFNPGLELIGFRTTRPWRFAEIQYQSCLIDSCAQQGWFKNLSHQHFKPMIKRITERFGIKFKIIVGCEIMHS